MAKRIRPKWRRKINGFLEFGEIRNSGDSIYEIRIQRNRRPFIRMLFRKENITQRR